MMRSFESSLPRWRHFAASLGTTTVVALVALATARAQTYNVLYSFTGGMDGGFPHAGVIADKAGNLFGTTYGGGSANSGVIFKVDANGRESALQSFTGPDGIFSWAGVTGDANGSLYGATIAGGTRLQGVIFKLDAAGTTTLHNFAGPPADGRSAYGTLVRDSAGNLYGTTGMGGAGCGASGCGTVFKLDSNGKETVLYSFAGPPADGRLPYAGVILDPEGNLYGTTAAGGSSLLGTVFKVDQKGQETVLYSFKRGDDAAIPNGGLVRDAAGNLYGTTIGGGKYGKGVVFKLDTTGTETLLYSFTGGTDGSQPSAGVIQDGAGNLYGTTYFGGASNLGVVFKLDMAGNETVLHSFSGKDGANPYGGVIRDAAGSLYGTTYYGGAVTANPCKGGTPIPPGCGVVFKIAPKD